MNDVRISPIIQSSLGSLLGEQSYGLSEDLLRQTLLIKTGEWDELGRWGLMVPQQFQDASALSLYLARGGSSSTHDEFERRRFAESLLGAFPADTGSLTWKMRAVMLPWLRATDPALFKRVDHELVRSLPSVIEDKPSEMAALYSVLVCAEEAHPSALELWAGTAIPFRNASSRLSRKEAVRLAKLAAVSDFGRAATAHTMEQISALTLNNGGSYHEACWVESQAMEELAAWIVNNLAQPLSSRHILWSIFGARNPDWIVPAGYLVNQILHDDNKMAVEDYVTGLQIRDRNWSSMLGLDATKRRTAHDGLWFTREADRAGDLVGLLELVARLESSEKLSRMALLLRDWQRLLGGDSMSTNVGELSV